MTGAEKYQLHCNHCNADTSHLVEINSEKRIEKCECVACATDSVTSRLELKEKLDIALGVPVTSKDGWALEREAGCHESIVDGDDLGGLIGIFNRQR